MNLKLKLTKLDLVIFVTFALFYWISRSTNLTNIPIFTDEAIYIRWSQIGLQDAAWRFIPLTDGKPPLYHWFLMIALKFIDNPLIAGRFISNISGFASAILIWPLTYFLFNKKPVAHLATLFYLISPFMLLYDRLAIVDSLLTTTSIASALMAVLLVKTLRLDTALLFGGAIGAALLTKASGLIFFLLSPFALLTVNWKKTQLVKKGLTWSGLMVISLILSQLIYAILRLSQFYYRIEQKNYEFIIPLSEFLQHPFAMTWGNAKSLFKWQLEYLSLVFLMLIIVSFFSRTKYKEKLMMLIYYVAPFIMIASFNKIIFPRFLLFSTPFLLILAAVGAQQVLDYLKKDWAKISVVAVLCLIPFRSSYLLITAPAIAPIPQADRDQYYDSWPAGHGISETVDYFRQQAEIQPIYVGTQGTFGLFPHSIEIYLSNHPNVEIHSFWPVDTVPLEVTQAAAQKKTFFIYNELENIPPQENLELIMEFTKQREEEIRHMRVFEVKPITSTNQ